MLRNHSFDCVYVCRFYAYDDDVDAAFYGRLYVYRCFPQLQQQLFARHFLLASFYLGFDYVDVCDVYDVDDDYYCDDDDDVDGVLVCDDDGVCYRVFVSTTDYG